jgi:hypothetical protein
LSLEVARRQSFLEALRVSGMPEAQSGFSVAPAHQVISKAMFEDIAQFIQIFERVVGRELWREAAVRDAPPIARVKRRETCFFSAWDFHLPRQGGFQMIEFNDNGSGSLFAAIINAAYFDAAGLAKEKTVTPPLPIASVRQTIADLVEQEAVGFFGARPTEMALILEEAKSLQVGRFRDEQRLLRELLREQGWRAELARPELTHWDGRRLSFQGQSVAFIVNRSTDFFWEKDEFAALRAAYAAGAVYVAPNPFSYATRSDKRLLEPLSSPHWDGDLGVEAEERRILSSHIPETVALRPENLEWLARNKHELVFKPLHGFAGRGLIDSGAVGPARLRRLLRRGEGYVAQKRVDKNQLDVDGVRLWTDLRVWAYRGQIYLISGRASTRPNRLDLAPPGGWLPTYVSR